MMRTDRTCAIAAIAYAAYVYSCNVLFAALQPTSTDRSFGSVVFPRSKTALSLQSACSIETWDKLSCRSTASGSHWVGTGQYLGRPIAAVRLVIGAICGGCEIEVWAYWRFWGRSKLIHSARRFRKSSGLTLQLASKKRHFHG